MKKKKVLVSTAQLAKHFGLNPRCIRRLAEYGMPVETKKPRRYVKSECQRWAFAPGTDHPSGVLKILMRSRMGSLLIPSTPALSRVALLTASEPSLAQPEMVQLTVEEITRIAQEAARRAVKEHHDLVKEGLSESVFELEQALEKALSNSGVLDKIAKHAVHLSDVAWMARFNTMSENPSV